MIEAALKEQTTANVLNFPQDTTERVGEIFTIENELLTRDKKYQWLVALSDLHEGSMNCRHSLLLRWLSWCRENNALILFPGDLINNSLINSVGSPYNEPLSPEKQAQKVIRILLPYKDLIIGIIGGNHERRTQKQAGFNPITYIATALFGCDKDGYPKQCYPEECFLKIQFGKNSRSGDPITYLVFSTHGWGGGRKSGGTLNSTESLLEFIPADLIITGHKHVDIRSVKVRYEADIRNNCINKKLVHFMVCPSFLDREDYAKTKGLAPTPLGAGVALLNGKKKQIITLIAG